MLDLRMRHPPEKMIAQFRSVSERTIPELGINNLQTRNHLQVVDSSSLQIYLRQALRLSLWSPSPLIHSSVRNLFLLCHHRVTRQLSDRPFTKIRHDRITHGHIGQNEVDMSRLLGTKEQEIMDFLHERFFDEMLQSQRGSDKLKTGVRYTIMRLEERDAAGMIHYYWSAIVGTERSKGFAAQMRRERFLRFEEAIDDFRARFNDKFLRA